MSCRYSFAVAFSTICLAGCFAHPDGGKSAESVDGVNAEVDASAGIPITGAPGAPALPQAPPQISPPGGPPANHMMKSLKDAGMPTPQFFESLDDTAKALFFNIRKNTTLTKGQMVSAIQNFMQSQPAELQAQYNEWLGNVSSWKNEMIAKIKSNLTGDALALANQIVSYMEDQSITNPETCKLIMGALKNVSQNITSEVRQAVLANGIGHGPEVVPPGMVGPGVMGGPGGIGVPGAPADMGGPGGMGVPGAPADVGGAGGMGVPGAPADMGGAGGMGGPMGMCSSGPQALHDGPYGHLDMVHDDKHPLEVQAGAGVQAGA